MHEPIVEMKYLQGEGSSYFEVVQNNELEGIVLKKKASRYEIGKRSRSWIKIKNYQYINVYITGYKKKDFGWLISYEDGSSAGIVELVGSKEARRDLFSIAGQFKTKETDNYVYLNPIVKCKVRYLYKTKKGFLREPSFVEFIIPSE